ncbi:MAG: CDP-alcohol phosphatidyltransferase family protein, partial [Candidatus Puniceispirillaceae bacterium]
MFDASLRPILETPLHWLAGGCIAVGLTANGLTILGFVFGVFCAVFVAMGFFVAALVCLILNRLCDGLDGAVARRSGSSDFGGYLDIVCDFLFYAMVPFAFMIFSQQNAVAAGFLMFSFVGTGSSFLAYAILEAKNPDALARKAQERASQKKSFFYLGGLTEGAETIAIFVLMLVFPGWF